MDKYETYIKNLYRELISRMEINNPNGVSSVKRAFDIAYKYHSLDGKPRQSGEPYIIHPLHVALIITDNNQYDTSLICASLLHDIVEDTRITLDDINNDFNEKVGLLVDGVTKISGKNLPDDQIELNNNIYIRRIINCINSDYRVIMIKLADRLHNMRTLEYKSPKKQKKISRETLLSFVPLARSIGAYKIEKELIDLSFMYLNPERYNEISSEVKEIRENIHSKLSRLGEDLQPIAREKGIEYRHTFGERSIFEIARKIDQGFDLKYMNDNFWLKIIINGEKNDCYKMLGIVHDKYKAVPGTLKDYISTPRSNLYSAIHTEIASPYNDGTLLKVKIRTEEDNKKAQSGIMASKLDAYEVQEVIKEKNPMARRIRMLDELTDKNNEFMNIFTKEEYGEHVYVMDENCNWVILPFGATIADYAIQVDPDNILNINDVILNGKHVSINEKLRNNDYIKLLYDKEKKDKTEIIKALETETGIHTFIKKYPL